MFLSAPCLGGFAFAGDRHVFDAEVGELLVDLGFAVAAVGGGGARRLSGPPCHLRHGRGQLRRMGWIALLHGAVQHDPVVVVNDLCLVPEFDRFAKPALAIGRASASCGLTRRVAPSGVVPATRCRVCATICRVA